eukprot:CAMPEP_0172755012 /NCGR_PEP_ID=MMETSP1074-20121228/159124_1 /TAXON_ID=2916 /ORGANISM="Ceratium fusus, Strain PA161109" /LENGTH=111 /DNA_ID=CAMNT_0013588041 /DNA_START=14 /DNA_END=345 /DNA_ORIENTATION=+
MEGTVLGRPLEAPALPVQLLGAVAIITFSVLASLTLFMCIRKMGILKSSALQQRRGLDHESNIRAYNMLGQVDRYRAMVCHVKDSHGTFARWMQLELGKYTGGKGSIFLDS